MFTLTDLIFNQKLIMIAIIGKYIIRQQKKKNYLEKPLKKTN